MPGDLRTDSTTFISPQDFESILAEHKPSEILLLDLRVSHQYAKSRISGAINLCISTMLLKRASHTVGKLATSISTHADRRKFEQWKEAQFIVVYDHNSCQVTSASSCVNVLKKFIQEDYQGTTIIVKGGFHSFSKAFPERIDEGLAKPSAAPSPQSHAIESSAVAPMAGGCMMPAAWEGPTPFFGTIRQNMDLIDGVGRHPIHMPASLLAAEAKDKVPLWLQQAADAENEGQLIADRFLSIEREEKERMTKALSVHVTDGIPGPNSPDPINLQVAGIEKGMKNRYKDILPFEHSRVRLRSIPKDGCDYINASHIEAKGSGKRYIACQAPTPSTFDDFWRMVWEQDIRMILMVADEKEGGTVKAHPYWVPGRYGPFELTLMSEDRWTLDRNSRGFNGKPVTNLDEPHLIIRNLSVSSDVQPSKSPRYLAQIQFSGWPDFGAPATPAHILSIRACVHEAIDRLMPFSDKVAKERVDRNGHMPPPLPVHPVIVHCSAGCGRTGTFCTIDTVLDMMDSHRVCDEKIDLIAETVSSFRAQRLSMVQSLRQFALCYETVLEWIGEKVERKSTPVLSEVGMV